MLKVRTVLGVGAVATASLAAESSFFSTHSVVVDPVIDVHLHALPVASADNLERYLRETRSAILRPVFDTLRAVNTDSALLEGTLAAMKQFNIVRGIISGPLAQSFVAAAPDRLMASLALSRVAMSPDSLRALLTSGKYAALGEISTQYSGIAPDDVRLDPYFGVAEDLDIPVGIHMGLGGPGAALYRVRFGNPLLLEDVLIKHPRLRVYVMHAGYPMAAEMIALMQAYPQVYVDIADIDWARPGHSFQTFLRSLIDAGLENRIMFGSDQVVWPGAIGRAILNIERTPFLSRRQKRAILCENASRFLRLPHETCSRRS
jgi:hypothetical protein